MHKLIVLYGTPDDPAHFRRHYEEVHVPLAEKVPGIQSMRYRIGVEGDTSLDGFAPFCIFEAEWDDAEALEAALASPQGHAVVADVANYASGGYVRLHFDI